MAGSSTLDPDILVDCLIPIIDDIRTDINHPFGVRQFRLFTVSLTRPARGSLGSAATVTETEILPRPYIKPWKLCFEKDPCGLDEAGVVDVREVSLCYSEPDLTGKNLPEGTEFYYKIQDAHGQEVCTRYFTLDCSPFADRDECIEWRLKLRSASVSL